MATVIFIFSNILLLYLVFGYCDANAFQCANQRKYGHFVKISSLESASNDERNANNIVNKCDFGRPLQIPHTTCTIHCLSNNCSAISHNDDGCRLGYEVNHTTNNDVDPEKTYIKLADLEALNDCTVDSCIAHGAICVDGDGSFECACPPGTFGNNCSACDAVHQESCYNVVFTPKSWADASDYCAVEGGHLMDILDDDEYEAVFHSELDIWRAEAYPLIDGTVYYVPNVDITASDRFSDNNDATQSRLNNDPALGVLNSGAWCVDHSAMPIWIQVKLSFQSRIVRIATQGLPSSNDSPDAFWVTSFKIQYLSQHSFDSELFETVSNESGDDMIFQGNVNKDDIKYNTIPGLVIAKYVRLLPVAWNERICLRWELYGFGAHIWIDGLYDTPSNTWIWSTMNTSIMYENWYSSHNPDPACLTSLADWGMRKVSGCGTARPFVCEYPSGGINECLGTPCEIDSRCVDLTGGYTCI